MWDSVTCIHYPNRLLATFSFLFFNIIELIFARCQRLRPFLQQTCQVYSFLVHFPIWCCLLALCVTVPSLAKDIGKARVWVFHSLVIVHVTSVHTQTFRIQAHFRFALCCCCCVAHSVSVIPFIEIDKDSCICMENRSRMLPSLYVCM